MEEIQKEKLENEPEKLSKNAHITETLKQFTSKMDNWADWAAEEEQEEEPQMSDHERQIRKAVEDLKPPFLVYVSELNLQATTEDIFFYLGGEEKVVEVYFYNDGYKNDALVELKEQEDLVKALLLTGSELYRKKLLVEYVDPLSCRCVDILKTEPVQDGGYTRYHRRETQQQRNRVSNDVRAFQPNTRNDVARFSNERHDDRRSDKNSGAHSERIEALPPVEARSSTKSNPFGKAKPINIDYSALIDTQEKPQAHAHQTAPCINQTFKLLTRTSSKFISISTDEYESQTSPTAYGKCLEKNRNDHKQSASHAPSLLDVNLGPQLDNRQRYESSTLDETESTASTVRNKDRENGRKSKPRYNKNRNDAHANKNKPDQNFSETGSTYNYSKTKSSESLVPEKRNAPDFSAITRHLISNKSKERKNVDGEKQAQLKPSDNALVVEPVGQVQENEKNENELQIEHIDNKETGASSTTTTSGKNKKRNKKRNENVNANLKGNKFHALDGINDH